jgi:DNA-binding transcriptional MerR regulator
MPMYTIGQVARHSGVGVETVRFYERRAGNAKEDVHAGPVEKTR